MNAAGQSLRLGGTPGAHQLGNAAWAAIQYLFQVDLQTFAIIALLQALSRL